MKKDLLKGVRKKDDEYLEELEDKWKLKLFGEHPIPIIESDADEPIEPYRTEPYKVAKRHSPFFCDMFPKHIERMRENKRREKTIGETIETYKDVIELLGNKPIGDYTNIDGRYYRNSLLKTPKNRKRVKRYRDKNIHELMSLDFPPSDKMSFENQSKLISRMTSCWNFFVDEYPEYVSENVFKSSKDD